MEFIKSAGGLVRITGKWQLSGCSTPVSKSVKPHRQTVSNVQRLDLASDMQTGSTSRVRGPQPALIKVYSA